MTALWIAVGFIVGNFIGLSTMALAFIAKNADSKMCEISKTSSSIKNTVE